MDGSFCLTLIRAIAPKTAGNVFLSFRVAQDIFWIYLRKFLAYLLLHLVRRHDIKPFRIDQALGSAPPAIWNNPIKGQPQKRTAFRKTIQTNI